MHFVYRPLKSIKLCLWLHLPRVPASGSTHLFSLELSRKRKKKKKIFKCYYKEIISDRHRGQNWMYSSLSLSLHLSSLTRPLYCSRLTISSRLQLGTSSFQSTGIMLPRTPWTPEEMSFSLGSSDPSGRIEDYMESVNHHWPSVETVCKIEMLILSPLSSFSKLKLVVFDLVPLHRCHTTLHYSSSSRCCLDTD